MSARISQSQLESYLWGAATLLRGTIDAGEYKSFIFPLLFLKRLSDVFDEEYEAALEESHGDEDYAFLPEQHRFQIPAGAHWSDLRQSTKDVGRAISKAMREIERANPRLDGVFGDAPWTNKDRLPDATLKELIEHYSHVTLSLHNVPEDELGVAYEFLIKKFADDSGHTAAEFYTNRTLVHLMTRLLEVEPGESVYDPTCGSGGMVLSAAEELRRQGKEHRTLRLFGQERNLTTSAIARMNLFLHGIEDFDVVRGDTLAYPAFTDGDQLSRFDVVIANPPYSIKAWDRDAWSSDLWGRNRYGTPPQGRADYAFWQHILASMDPKTGRCAILFPHGVLFCDEERDMRRRIVAADLVEAVIGLGPNLFYNSPMESCIVVCRAKKPAERVGKVLFIDAVNEVTRERAQSFLTDDHIDRIVRAFRAFEPEDGFSAVETLDAIAERNSNLSIPLYVTREGARSGHDLSAALAEWRQSSSDLRSAAQVLFARLDTEVTL
ncbi:MAG: SAM-dependent DNA methyltransferase [Acidimicrobiaceae bacterium]|nr:SAM-dependent DNA methyltransferase [Acidimicrobiaceae bacterium]MYD08324.1 SAM-dependent DNA methyltransferase [Acidimicrobiaceae bacterium]MYI58655.1 SAM-dependent DNA methyltransferase [Acidimicrobiaceae bacterium]